MVVSLKTFRILTRVLCYDPSINPRVFSRRGTSIPFPYLHRISRCLCTETGLEKQNPQAVELPAAVPEKLQEKRIANRDIAINIYDFVDNFPVLQNLVDLGVEIYKFNRDQSLCKFLMKLDFDCDIKPYLVFLIKNGVPEHRLGEFLTQNPYIIQTDLNDLQVRINYLESKKFTKEMIAHIITENPKWLIRCVEDIDSRLGDVQKSFQFSGDQIRSLVTSFPGIATIRKEDLTLNIFTFKEEFGITLKDCQNLLLREPRLLKISNSDLINTFHYLIYNMTIPVDLILEHPKVLKHRAHLLKIRHSFLHRLGRSQYNPKLPGYVSLTDLTTTSDEEFCKKIAKSSLMVFYKFQKTL